jgi:hypothetical protein
MLGFDAIAKLPIGVLSPASAGGLNPSPYGQDVITTRRDLPANITTTREL